MPLGVPVVPEVYRMNNGCSASKSRLRRVDVTGRR